MGVRGVHPHHEGDGTSDSSIGTESPELFPPPGRSGRAGDGDAFDDPPAGAADVQVTAEDLASGAPHFLHVRRGSDDQTTTATSSTTPFIGVEDDTKSWKSLPQTQANPASMTPADGPTPGQGSSQSLSNVST